MVLTGTINDSDGSRAFLKTEGATYNDARENLYALLKVGQKLIVIRTDHY